MKEMDRMKNSVPPDADWFTKYQWVGEERTGVVGLALCCQPSSLWEEVFLPTFIVEQ